MLLLTHLYLKALWERRIQMLERIKSLYLSGQLDENGLARAVKRKWITEEQAEEIRNIKAKG